MGQQAMSQELKVKSSKTRVSSSNQLKCKTSFHYIHPIKCEIEQHSCLEEQTIPRGDQIPQEIDLQTHEAEYWEIQNNQEDIEANPPECSDKIQQIKVKWNEFIKMKKRNYLEDYTVLKQIGRGGYGCVHKVKARYTGLYRAAKRIKKSQLKKSDHEKLFEQMAIMMSLDHPNIAKLYEVYDYKSYYVLVVELCEGGELFKKIVTKQLDQEFSGRVMKQILWTLIYLHKKGIVHRDLKPENMLFQLDSDTLKLIDFGIAAKKKPDQVLTQRLGTPYYIAPQVLCKNYGQKCDIWSAGIILFMMISGYPPFKGQNECEVMETILKQNVEFKGHVWNKITSDCKNMISWMLKKNPDQRPSAQEAFSHPWIKRFAQKGLSKKEQNVMNNIQGFSFKNKLQAVVYTYVVSQLLTSEEKKFLFEIFKELDKNNDGVIESIELYEALRTRKDVSEERVKFLMRIIDTNGSGHIDYTEFLVAAIDPNTALNEYHFQQAFQYFDIDHSGAITFQQIVHFLENTKQSQESIKKIFKQVDQNNDGHISKEEFVKLLMNETKKKINSYRSFREDFQKPDNLKVNGSSRAIQRDSSNFHLKSTGNLVSSNTLKQPELKQNVVPPSVNKSMNKLPPGSSNNLRSNQKLQSKTSFVSETSKNQTRSKNQSNRGQKESLKYKHQKKVLVMQ